MKRIALTAIALLLAMAGTASAGLIASSTDEGSVPHAEGEGEVVMPKQGPMLVVTGTPSAPIEVTVDVDCRKGRVSRSAQRKLPARLPPIQARIALTINKPDECDVRAYAEFQDYEVVGRIGLSLRSPYAR